MNAHDLLQFGAEYQASRKRGEAFFDAWLALHPHDIEEAVKGKPVFVVRSVGGDLDGLPDLTKLHGATPKVSHVLAATGIGPLIAQGRAHQRENPPSDPRMAIPDEQWVHVAERPTVATPTSQAQACLRILNESEYMSRSAPWALLRVKRQLAVLLAKYPALMYPRFSYSLGTSDEQPLPLFACMARVFKMPSLPTTELGLAEEEVRAFALHRIVGDAIKAKSPVTVNAGRPDGDADDDAICIGRTPLAIMSQQRARGTNPVMVCSMLEIDRLHTAEMGDAGLFLQTDAIKRQFREVLADTFDKAWSRADGITGIGQTLISEMRASVNHPARHMASSLTTRVGWAFVLPGAHEARSDAIARFERLIESLLACCAYADRTSAVEATFDYLLPSLDMPLDLDMSFDALHRVDADVALWTLQQYRAANVPLDLIAKRVRLNLAQMHPSCGFMTALASMEAAASMTQVIAAQQSPIAVPQPARRHGV